MDSLDIRAMLTYVGNSTPCPICKEKIPSSAIKIVETTDTYCSIDFSCEFCKEDFSGQIHMQKINMPDNTKLNASTQVATQKKISEEISENEVQAMHNLLEKEISFSDLFGENTKSTKSNKKPHQ